MFFTNIILLIHVLLIHIIFLSISLKQKLNKTLYIILYYKMIYIIYCNDISIVTFTRYQDNKEYNVITGSPSRGNNS